MLKLDSTLKMAKKSAVGTPSNLGLIFEHITILKEVRILSI
jgi:hypothetical protein